MMPEWVIPILVTVTAVFAGVALTLSAEYQAKWARLIREDHVGCPAPHYPIKVAYKRVKYLFITLCLFGIILPGVLGSLIPVRMWDYLFVRIIVSLAFFVVIILGYAILKYLGEMRGEVEDLENPIIPFDE